MEEIIKIAIEGGWKPNSWDKTIQNENGATQIKKLSKSEIREDPLFWSSLGKALGWGELTVSRDDWTQQPKWLYEWHRFIDHLASGKDSDSFFSALISTKE